MEVWTIFGLLFGVLSVVLSASILVYATATGKMYFNGRFDGFARKDHPRLFVIEYVFWMIAVVFGAWIIWLCW